MGDVLIGFRYTLRSLGKARGFTAVAVLTLAVGIGASTLIFSFGNWVAWRPVPGMREPGRLVTVELLRVRPGEQTRGWALSYPDINDFGRDSPSLATIGAYNPGSFGLAVPGALPRELQGAYVTRNYFALLGVTFAAGGPFTLDQERRAAADPIAVISYRLWKNAFASAPDLIGRRIMLSGVPFTVVGIAVRGFHGARLLGNDDVWAPISAQAAVYHDLSLDLLTYRGPGKTFNQAIARLAPGAAMQRAQLELQRVVERLADDYPAEDGGYRGFTIVLQRGIGVPPRSRAALEHSLSIVSGIGAIILLIALANVANLCLLRAARKGTDLALRRALGATGGALVRQQLAETVLLALAGGVLALLLVRWATPLFNGLQISQPDMAGDIHPVDVLRVDWRGFAFALAVALVVGVTVGLVPAPSFMRVDLSSALKDRATRGSSRRPFLHGLSIVQLMASLTLLVGALLLVGTLRNLRRVELGFDAPHVSFFMMDGLSGGQRRIDWLPKVPDILERVGSLPGVDDVGLIYAPPFAGVNLTGGVRSDETAGSDLVPATHMWVSPGYFATLGIPLLAGRTFRPEEMQPFTVGREGAAVISETLARRVFGTWRAVGRRVAARTGRYGDTLSYRIVGVVKDSKWNEVVGVNEYGPMLYRPLGEDSMRTILTVVTRSRRPAATQAQVRRALGEIVPTVPIYLSGTLEERVSQYLTPQRLFATAATACSLLALLLGGVGLYAVIAFSVAERHKEIGIRMALGAGAGEVVRMVLRQGLRSGGAGVALGLAAAAALSRLLASRLFGLKPLEPVVYLAAALMLFALVLVASFFPARAATRVDPMVALRSE